MMVYKAKIDKHHRFEKILFFLVFFIFKFCWSQHHIEGFVLDAATDEPLPYCSIEIYGANAQYAITNEDGKFSFNGVFSSDSLEIRHIGYKPQKVASSYFENESEIYLDEDVSELDEIILTADQDKEYPYTLLGRIVDKYRKRGKTTIGKAFLTLTSSARNIPIEQTEGFYNSEQSLSMGITGLSVKSGRFGQNRRLPFYSLDNTKILVDFELFGTSGQILPNYPGHMSPDAIKRRYVVKIDSCSFCKANEASVSFSSKRPNGKLFNGRMLLDHVDLVVKKIELAVQEPSTNALSSINENVKLTPMEIQLNVVFNPLDYDKVQYYDFSFRMRYETGNINETIDSNTFLYFYDYNDPFEEPYFTQEISFNNDYDKMIALQASDDFWEANYQFPKSLSNIKAIDFMKRNGYLVNYDSYISLTDIEFTKPAVLSWQKERVKWGHFSSYSPSNMSNAGSADFPAEKDLTAGKAYDSPFDARRANMEKKGVDKLNISYMVDSFVTKKDGIEITSRTLMDLKSSHFGSNRSMEELAYINMVFDIYEVYRQLAASRITAGMSFLQAKTIYGDIYRGASIEAKNLKKETKNGTDNQAMTKWNDRIKARLNVDNIEPHR